MPARFKVEFVSVDVLPDSKMFATLEDAECYAKELALCGYTCTVFSVVIVPGIGEVSQSLSTFEHDGARIPEVLS